MLLLWFSVCVNLVETIHVFCYFDCVHGWGETFWILWGTFKRSKQTQNSDSVVSEKVLETLPFKSSAVG